MVLTYPNRLVDIQVFDVVQGNERDGGKIITRLTLLAADTLRVGFTLRSTGSDAASAVDRRQSHG